MNNNIIVDGTSCENHGHHDTNQLRGGWVRYEWGVYLEWKYYMGIGYGRLNTVAPILVLEPGTQTLGV